MNKIQFLAQDDFPATLKTWDFLQNMIHISANAFKLGGSNYIVSGCNELAGVVSSGIIAINGEVLPFLGGAKKGKISIVEKKEDTSAFNKTYKDAYISRYAEFSDTGVHNWSDFKVVVTNAELAQRIADLKTDAPGTIKQWAGYVNKIPSDYMLADGRVLKITDYPELFENIGFLHGVDGTDGFRLPDTRDNFVYSYGSGMQVGEKGGANEIKLDVSQLPPHSHNFPGVILDTNNWRSGDSAGGYMVMGRELETKTTGEGKPIDNRPAFIVLAQIIKVI